MTVLTKDKGGELSELLSKPPTFGKGVFDNGDSDLLPFVTPGWGWKENRQF